MLLESTTFIFYLIIMENGIIRKLKNFGKKFKIIRFAWNCYLKIKIKFSSKKIKRRRPALIQLLPCFSKYDAIGNATQEFSDFLLKKGIENYIVYLTLSGFKYVHNGYFYNKFKFTKSDTVILHLAIGSPLSREFKKIKVRKKIIIYHNITPLKYCDNKYVKSVCEAGRKEMSYLYNVPDLSISDSSFNESELIELGYNKTYVIPLPTKIYELLKFRKNKTDSNCFNIITVGRIVKNKCIVDDIKTFEKLHDLIKNSHLYIIGSNSQDSYYSYVLKTINKSKYKKFIHIVGKISTEKLAYYYSLADAYLCMSEHEGFCIPLVEAMAFGIPVFAFNSSAIPETVGDAGVLFNTKDYDKNASIIFDILKNKSKTQALSSLGMKRYRSKFNNDTNMKKYINTMLTANEIKEMSVDLRYYSYIKDNFDDKVTYSDFPLNLKEYIDNNEKYNH